MKKYAPTYIRARALVNTHTRAHACTPGFCTLTLRTPESCELHLLKKGTFSSEMYL